MGKANGKKKGRADKAAPPPSRVLPGWRPPPFLTDPAVFQQEYSEEEYEQILAESGTDVPEPRRSPPVLDLREVIGDDVGAITESGRIVFHAVGDTGRGLHTPQTDVARAMDMDYERPNTADQPAFLLHLGDVIYGVPKKQQYPAEFYHPSKYYRGNILAIPGNHDASLEEDPDALTVFQKNFCAGSKVKVHHGRPQMRQPGVYFLLEAPFVRVFGLYTNAAEGPGFIAGGPAGQAQKDFLVEQLKAIRKKRDRDGDRRALLVATHHPPYSGGGHGGSKELLRDLDDAFARTGVFPHAVLSGHAHNYQRFTRRVALGDAIGQIPFLVVGTGGHDSSPVRPDRGGHPVKTPLRGVGGDLSLQQYYNGYGYLLATATPEQLILEFWSVNPVGSTPLDRVVVELKTHQILEESPPLTHPMDGEERGWGSQPRRS
jgi:hypothetical protein